MKTLKAVAARYNATSLILRIVIGLVVGAVLALAVPGAGWVEEFGWCIGHAAWGATQSFFFDYIPGFTHENFEFVEQSYQNNAFLAIFGAALTPIPYKIFTIAAGVCNVPIATLVLASLVGRGGRFFAVALIVRIVGPKARDFIDKYFNILASAFFVLLVLGFVAVKYLMK